MILFLLKVRKFSRLLPVICIYVDSKSLCVCPLWEVVTGQTLCWRGLICLMALTFTHNPVSETWHLCWKSFFKPSPVNSVFCLPDTFLSLLRPLATLLQRAQCPCQSANLYVFFFCEPEQLIVCCLQVTNNMTFVDPGFSMTTDRAGNAHVNYTITCTQMTHLLWTITLT